MDRLRQVKKLKPGLIRFIISDLFLPVLNCICKVTKGNCHLSHVKN